MQNGNITGANTIDNRPQWYVEKGEVYLKVIFSIHLSESEHDDKKKDESKYENILFEKNGVVLPSKDKFEKPGIFQSCRILTEKDKAIKELSEAVNNELLNYAKGHTFHIWFECLWWPQLLYDMEKGNTNNSILNLFRSELKIFVSLDYINIYEPKEVKLKVVRECLHDTFTEGEMLINIPYSNEYTHLCYTLEDTDRDLDSNRDTAEDMIKVKEKATEKYAMNKNGNEKNKEKGVTAIPIGIYNVVKASSPKYSEKGGGVFKDYYKKKNAVLWYNQQWNKPIKNTKGKITKYEKQPNGGIEMPRLENVPAFDGILIHTGNWSHNTDGCILVGKERNTGHKMVNNSVDAWKNMMDILLRPLEKENNVSIEVTRQLENERTAKEKNSTT